MVLQDQTPEGEFTFMHKKSNLYTRLVKRKLQLQHLFQTIRYGSTLNQKVINSCSFYVRNKPADGCSLGNSEEPSSLYEHIRTCGTPTLFLHHFRKQSHFQYLKLVF